MEDLGLIYITPNTRERKRYGIFECPKCSLHVKMPVASAKKVKFCASCRDKTNPLKHGYTGKRLYNMWKNIKARCLNTNHHQYKDYMGKGISLYKNWEEFEPFKDWALSNGYSDILTIDRINNDLGYYPDNCRFTDRLVQARNKRKLMSTNTSGFRGVTKTSGSFTWNAQILVDNKRTHIGTFDTKELAAKAYDNYVKSNNLEHTTNE